MDLNDTAIVVARISATVSLVTFILSSLFKPWFEKHFVIFKLEAEHQYEQKKEIKKVIARNKAHLLDAAESLNHRLWNLANNYAEGWHYVSDLSTLSNQYYWHLSFIGFWHSLHGTSCGNRDGLFGHHNRITIRSMLY